jgi:hypothetical protein
MFKLYEFSVIAVNPRSSDLLISYLPSHSVSAMTNITCST